MSKLNFKFPIEHPGLTYLDQLEIWKGGGGFGVDKIKSIMNYLDNPQDKVRSIHVTGTNGKGTTSAVLASVLGAAGNKVGLNTSPHLISPNERIVVDGVPISYENIGEFALKVQEAAIKTSTELSFHEGITATAFVAFNELGVEWSVIEVGLGGRYDSSNIISKPEASIITTIDLDHQHILGDSRPQIAFEKAGIIKDACPVIIGALDNESKEVIEKVAEEHNSPIYRLTEHFSSTSFHDKGFGSTTDSFEFRYANEQPIKIEKGILGHHQVDNFSVALAAARLCGLAPEACRIGAKQVFWPGRLEVFNWKNRTIIVDCAHNPHGISALVDNLNRWGLKDIDIAFGVLDGKNWREMVEALVPFSRSWSLLTPSSERALDIGVLADLLSGFGVSNIQYGRDMARFIQNHDNGTRPLLLTGSIYLVGELRELFSGVKSAIWHKH